jgi:GAF domain-containing protein
MSPPPPDSTNPDGTPADRRPSADPSSSPDGGSFGSHSASGDPTALLRALALRIEAGRRLAPSGGSAVLRSIVDATATLFDAEAASLALHDPAADRLVFVVAAGEHGQGVVGLSVASGEGVAGYVFATGQPIALADVEHDARFGRRTAEQTGYVPRSLVAVPLIDDEGILGVLEVLDKRGAGGWDLRDIELASVFAHQACVAIRASRIERDTGALMRAALGVSAGSPDAVGGVHDFSSVEDAIADAVTQIGAGDDDPLWALADQIARLRDGDRAQLDLVREILGVLVRRAERNRAEARTGSVRPRSR